MIFANPNILNTPALLRLGAVSGAPANYAQHKDFLHRRLAILLDAQQAELALDEICDLLVWKLGPEGLTECKTMGIHEIAENILLTSPGAALLSDLRERWAQVSQAELQAAGNQLPDDDFEDEFPSFTLEQWLETLVSAYIDIE